MSISSWLEERLGQRVRYEDGSLVSSGSPVEYRFSAGPDFWKTVSGALALAKRHLPLSQAKAAVERLVDGEAVIATVPCVEDRAAFEQELAELHVEAKQIAREDKQDRAGAAAE